jgi:hypothetical protein
LAFGLDSDFLVVAKVRDELFGSVGKRLASLGCVNPMKSYPFSATLVHDGKGVAVRNADNLASEVFSAGKS